MTMAQSQQQTVPVQIHQTDDRIVLAAPMPGLEPEDISVAVAGDRVTIRGKYRGARQGQENLLVSEWTIGPYYREIVLPQPVDGALTNASYGNGVLVLSMPKVAQGQRASHAEFRLEVIEATRGQRVGHTGSNIQPTTTQEHRQRMEQTAHPGEQR
jgi:HSP20 family protein